MYREEDIQIVKFIDGRYGVRIPHGGRFAFLSVGRPDESYWWFEPNHVDKWCKARTERGARKALKRYLTAQRVKADVGVPV